MWVAVPVDEEVRVAGEVVPGSDVEVDVIVSESAAIVMDAKANHANSGLANLDTNILHV